MEGQGAGDRLEQRGEQAKREAEASLENVQGGRRVRVRGEEVPVRPLVAIGVFVAAFVVVYLLSWTIFGGIGLVIGAVLGLLAGALAAKLYADRAAAGSA